MSDNADALAALDAVIEAARNLQHAPEALAKAIAPELRKEIEGNIAAGRDPEGNAWPKTKAGEKPLKNAAKALAVRTSGATVIAEITGPEALHHLGLARGHVQRRILPRQVTPGVARAAEVALQALAPREK
jgi:hypothetical protein